jgi:hypothetical protein
MVNPMPLVLRTMMGDSTFGMTWQKTVRIGRMPRASLASTKVACFTDLVSAATVRANHGQYVMVNATSMLGRLGPSLRQGKRQNDPRHRQKDVGDAHDHVADDVLTVARHQSRRHTDQQTGAHDCERDDQRDAPAVQDTAVDVPP